MGSLRESGAGEGNRTLVISLEGFCSTIELHPPRARPVPPESSPPTFTTLPVFRVLDPGGEGWIRTNVGARPTDLQSAPFNHSGTSPRNSQLSTIREFWANETGVSALERRAGGLRLEPALQRQEM